jgi:hypothetical protein
MRRVLPIVFAGAAVLVSLDIVGALAGKPLGIPYSQLSVVSLLIYIGTAALAAWRTSFGLGLAAAIGVGFLDGMFGPLAAWMVGSGPVSQTIAEPRIFAYSVAVVTAVAAAAGVLGALAGIFLERRRTLRGVAVR